MGNTVHRTLPGTRGAAPRGGVERSVLPGQPQARSPGCTRESGCLSLIPGAAPLPGRAAPAWFSWPWPCALRLCSSPRSLRSKPGAIGASPGRSLQGGCGARVSRVPARIPQAPPPHVLLLGGVPTRAGLRPARVSAQLGVLQPHLSRCCGAHRPLVKSALEFPRPEKGGGRGAWGGRAEAGGTPHLVDKTY